MYIYKDLRILYKILSFTSNDLIYTHFLMPHSLSQINTLNYIQNRIAPIEPSHIEIILSLSRNHAHQKEYFIPKSPLKRPQCSKHPNRLAYTTTVLLLLHYPHGEFPVYHPRIACATRRRKQVKKGQGEWKEASTKVHIYTHVHVCTTLLYTSI